MSDLHLAAAADQAIAACWRHTDICDDYGLRTMQ